MYKEAKIKKVGIKELLEKKEIPSKKFDDIFSIKLDEIVKSLEKGNYDPELNDKIDEVIMLLKERIEKWDVPSVRFGTKELFLKLYKYSGDGKRLTNLYNIYEDLFRFAYLQRKHILGNMINVFYSIWLEAWLFGYDVEKAEKCCDILLRLGLDFIDNDLSVAEDCLNMIDNAAGDMFEPEILSREILFAAAVGERKDESEEMKKFFETIIDYIKWNDEYAWDDENYSYLIDSLSYAESIQDEYNINIENIKTNYLMTIAKNNMNKRIDEYLEYLVSGEYEDEFREFEAEYLSKLLLAYEKIDPNIVDHINSKIEKIGDQKLKKEIDMIIDQHNLLKKFFRGSEMIASLKELIRFLENTSDIDNLGVGITTYGPSWIVFHQKLNKKDKEELRKLAIKYDIYNSEFEISDNEIMFEMDFLVYLGNNKHDMRRLIQFLKDIDKKFKVKSLVTGIEFRFK